MNRKKYQQLVEQVRALPRETILSAANRCDGHTIFKPAAFRDAGLPQEVVDHLTRNHASDRSSPKSTIFVNGQPVTELAGIYGLDLLRFLADALGVEYARSIGRGFQAPHIQAALKRHFHSASPAR